MIRSPYGNEFLEAFAEQALKEEHLGQHSGTDVSDGELFKQRFA